MCFFYKIEMNIQNELNSSLWHSSDEIFLHFELRLYLMKKLHVFHYLNLSNKNSFDKIFHHLKRMYSLSDMHLFPHLFSSVNNVKTV